jgi:hypothetical protein
MAQFGFCSASYTSESVLADCQICRNWYLESVESGMGKSAYVLYRTPGLATFATLPGRSVRGTFAINGRMFAVVGTTLYEVMADGTYTAIGLNLPDDLSMASLAASQIQLLVASGGNIYVFYLQNVTLNGVTVPAGTFQQVSQSNGTGPVGPISQVTYADGEFLALLSGTNKFQMSNPNDATTWSDLYVFEVSEFPENLVGMIQGFREPFFLGGGHSAFYYNSGDVNNPWQPVSGGFMEQGCAAQWSPAKLDNSFFWLGQDDRGQAMVWRANGYLPVRVSNHAIENEFNGYSTVADAIGYTYQENGHSFYVLNFPTAGKTWVYDVATGLWHDRARRNGNDFEMWHGITHSFAFGKHLVGDWNSGKIYQQSISILTDNGANIRRQRRAPHISSEQAWIRHAEMQVDAEVGIGPIPALPGQGAGPTQLQLADVSGNAWQLTIDDASVIQYAELAGGAQFPPIVNDGQNAGVTWQFGVGPGPVLQITQVAYDSSAPQLFQMATSGTQLQTGLAVLNGVITIIPATAGQRDPKMMLRWSDDGGKTWSSEHWVSAGKAGTYKTRCIWRRLGRSRDRVYEVTVDDPIAWTIINAYLRAAPGFDPQQRLNKRLAQIA